MSRFEASDWLTNSDEIPDTIFYSSVRNEEHNRVMTLLVIPEIDEDEDEDVKWEAPKFHR